MGLIRIYVRFSNHDGECPAGWDVPRFLFATVNLEAIKAVDSDELGTHLHFTLRRNSLPNNTFSIPVKERKSSTGWRK